jgi:mannitol/fructose-specific phosphotransferase system IIA component (Ntr-type)
MAIIFWPFIMNLCHYLTQNNILFVKDTSSKEVILSFLAAELAKLNNLKNSKDLVQSILTREQEGSTFLPTGIAIPHTRTPDVSEIALAMGVIPQGFKESPDSESTYLVTLFFSPIKDKEFGRHLKLLAKISAIFRDPGFVKEIANLGDPSKIFTAIQQKERDIEE